MIEEFFDLRIATVGAGDPPPPEAHWVRVEDPAPSEIEHLGKEGWFHKPAYVTYILPIPVSIDAYIEQMFRSRARNKPRRLLRDVPKKYRFVVEIEDETSFPQFLELYRRTVVERPRGKDRLGEHDHGLDKNWMGYYLFEKDAMVAGILVHRMRRHLSVAYGAFCTKHRRKYDLEHYLIMQVMQRAIDERHRMMSLGMDTNRYGHHLSLQLPVYKLRIGFVPVAYEPAGREMVQIRSFAPFEKGLFFYSFEGNELVGNLFHRGNVDLRPYKHHQGPPIRERMIASLERTRIDR